MIVQKTTLNNGLTIITLTHQHAHSCALGLWLRNGTRHQLPEQDGYAHLLEHLLLRGETLNQRFDAMGGEINAQTGRELTALYGLVPKQNALELLGLFSDALLTLRVAEDELALEKQVVQQESTTLLQSPWEELEQMALSQIWPNQAIGWLIAGRGGALDNLSVARLEAYLENIRCGRRLAVVAVGAVTHEAVLSACDELASLSSGPGLIVQSAAFTSVQQPFIAENAAYTHLLWLLPAPAPGSEQYTALLAANHILSARLYKALREQRGLVYGVHSELEFYSDVSLWKVQLSCATRYANECQQLVNQAMADLMGNGPTVNELDCARNHLAARLQLANDDFLSTMQRLSREYFYLGRNPGIEDYIDRLNGLDTNDVISALNIAWLSFHKLFD